jgi:hypothetical protein
MKSILLSFMCAIAIMNFAHAQQPPQPPEPQVNALEQALGWDTNLEKAMRQVRGPRDEDPLRYLTGDMTVIVGDLSRCQTDKPVQAKEDNVVGELNYLITLLEKQCSKSGGGSSLNPTKPRADSIIANGPGGINDLHDPKAGEKQWGNLPPKLREQILQSKTDGFPQGYEALLQSYYRRLATEQVNTGDEKQPTTAPSR